MENMCAMIDFNCLEADCDHTIEFNLMGLKANNGLVSCPHCHSQYELKDESFIGKLEKLRNLLLAVRDAEEILGDVNVGVTTMSGQTKIPYRILLTRLNTTITLELEGQKVDFAFRVEPTQSNEFR